MQNVKYIGPSVLTAPELKQYIDFSEIVQSKVAMDPPKEVLEALYELFGIKPGRRGYANFEVPPFSTMKSMFKTEVFPKARLETALDKINGVIEVNNQFEKEEISLDYLFSMLYKLKDLNHILEEIRSRMNSILRT